MEVRFLGQSHQSTGFEPETTTLIRTSSGPGVGIGESMMLTFGPGPTSASFMMVVCCDAVLVMGKGERRVMEM